MSEFKFACPVCGQHMAADSTVSGMNVECPTCFQKVIVPQPPAANSKYVLSATQYIKPKAPPARPVGTRFAPKKKFGPILIPVVVICVAGAVLFVLYNTFIAGLGGNATKLVPSAPARPKEWNLDLAHASFPEHKVAGKIAGRDFQCDRAVLQGGTLTLRQGASGSPEPRVTIYLFASEAEQLRGQSLTVHTNDTGMPRVVMRWSEGEQGLARSFNSGYALRLDFGTPAAIGMPGRIYLCLPDDSGSYVAGTFNAEIKKMAPPKSAAPKPAIPH